MFLFNIRIEILIWTPRKFGIILFGRIRRDYQVFLFIRNIDQLFDSLTTFKTTKNAQWLAHRSVWD